MSDNPNLGFSVDTSELDAATKALDDVTAASGRTEQAAGKAGQAGSKMAHDFVPGAESMAGATERSQRAAEAYIQSLQKQLDMLGKNKSEQAAIQAQYAGFSAQVQQQAAEIGKKIDAWHREEAAAKAAAKAEEQAAKGAATATEGMQGLSFATAGSTREFIVIGHEIVSGNFSRIPGSIMVLMERMGGLGSAVSALMSMFGLMAAAGVGSIAALGVALYKGSEESKAFNNAIALTNNYVGETSSTFEDMATRVANANHVSAGSVREMAEQLVQTGQVGHEQLGLLSDAAERFAKLTSGDASDAAKHFARAMDDPAKGAIELNKQMHFLTLAQYDQIVALQKSGDEEKAQLILSKALDDHLRSASLPNLGYIARAWDSVTGAVTRAWDAMKGFGRDSTKAEQIAANNAAIAKLSVADPNSQSSNGAAWQIANLRAANAKLQAEMAADTKAAQDKASKARVQQEGVTAQEQYNRFKEQFATPAEKRQREIAEQLRNLDNIAAAGGKVTQTMRNDAVAKINAHYKDKKGQKAKKPKVDHAAVQEDREISSAEAAYAKAKQQLDMLDQADDRRLAKLTEAEKKIADLRAMMNMAQSSRQGKVSNSQIESEIAAWEKVVPLQKQYMQNELDRQRADAADKAALKTTASWNTKDAKQLDKYRLEADTVGLDANQRKILSAQMAIEEDRRQAIDQLMEKTGAKSETEVNQLYPKQIKAINDAADARKERMIPALQEEINLSQSWASGWSSAFAKYRDNAANQASDAAKVFNSVTNGMSSTLTSFFETGKLGWKSFATSILQEIERIMVAKMAAGLLSSVAGAFMGGASDGASASTSGADYGMTSASQSSAWSAGSISYHAKGAAFTNSVLSSPTAFQDSSGGMHVAGEAGDEAVMPLTRDASGNLGVRASGGSAGDIVINQYVTIASDGATKTTGDGAASGMLANMSDAIKGIVQQGIGKELRQGGMIYKALRGSNG